MQEIFLARQPIVDHRENLFGFELLFRSCNDNNADIQESMCASEQVLRDVFGDMGFANEDDACVRDHLRLTWVNLNKAQVDAMAWANATTV